MRKKFRKLSVKQKKILEEVAKKAKNYLWWEDLSQGVQEELEKINMFEDLIGATNRFLQDEIGKIKHGNKG